MPSHGGKIWDAHPHVRSGGQLSAGERAGDVLKHWFGTWTLLGLILAAMLGWLLLVNDPGELHLNLALSCMAAVQGIVLQIAANRIDRINAEAAVHHGELTQQIAEQTKLLTEIHKHISALSPQAGDFNA